jgi:hypothetical protein
MTKNRKYTYKKITEETYNQVRNLVSLHIKAKDISTILKIGRSTLSRVICSVDWEEYKKQLAAINSKYNLGKKPVSTDIQPELPMVMTDHEVLENILGELQVLNAYFKALANSRTIVR